MSKPRYEPRSFFVVKRHFGQVVDPKLTPLPEKAPAALRAQRHAALLQSEISRSIRNRLRERGWTVADYAHAVAGLGADHDVSADRIGKVLRGAAIMRFEDLADAARVFDAEVNVALRPRRDTGKDSPAAP